MARWETIASEPVPNDEGTIFLISRGTEWVIHVDGRELMGNRQHGSEAALADLACDRLDDLENARVLVGGLGMGFTLAAALRRIGPNAHATVAELMPAVVRWNRMYTGKAAKHPLRDSRAEVYEGDVGDLIERCDVPWSTILLDVDNGPEALTRPTNGWLYTDHGLQCARESLIPGGVLGIWSARPDKKLTGRLYKAGFEVEVVEFVETRRITPAHAMEHVLWMAKRPQT